MSGSQFDQLWTRLNNINTELTQARQEARSLELLGPDTDKLFRRARRQLDDLQHTLNHKRLRKN